MNIHLAGLGEAAQQDVASAMKALGQPGGAATMRQIAKKFTVRAQDQAQKATAAAVALTQAANTPPTNSNLTRAMDAHDAFVAAATANGRLSIAGNLMSQAADANAAAAGGDANALKRAAQLTAGAAAAVTAPANTGINTSPSLMVTALGTGAPLAAAAIAPSVNAQPPGTVPSSGGFQTAAGVLPPGTALPYKPKLQVPIGRTAQGFGRDAGLGYKMPASLSPTKGGAVLPAGNYPPLSPRLTNPPGAPNPSFYPGGGPGAPIGTVAAFRGGGLGGLGTLNATLISTLLDTAKTAAANATNSVAQQAQQATNGGAISPTDPTGARQVAINLFQTRIGPPQGGGTWSSVNSGSNDAFTNGAWVIHLYRDSDAARGQAVVGVDGTVHAHAIALVGDAGYDSMPGPTPSSQQTTIAAQNGNSTTTKAPPVHGSTAQSGGDDGLNPDTSGGGSSTPNSGFSSWSFAKKATVVGGGLVAVVVGLKLLL